MVQVKVKMRMMKVTAMSADNELVSPVKKLHTTWNSVQPPKKEEGLIGKWYGVVYESKSLLYWKSSRALLGK